MGCWSHRLSRVSKNNKGVGYILVIIDIFSRFLWLRPLKTKTGLNAANAFEKVFLEGRRPKYLRTDKGQEFKARVVQEVFKRYNIRHFVTQNEVKANYAERVSLLIKHARTLIYFQTWPKATITRIIEVLKCLRQRLPNKTKPHYGGSCLGHISLSEHSKSSDFM